MNDGPDGSAKRPGPGEDGDHVTFCRICTASCGLIATVRDGAIVHARPDAENPSSRGHVCVKGVSYHKVTHDPDRVTHPLKRVAPGQFQRVSWDEALDDIAARLSAIIERHGPEAVASYQGNPPAYSTDGMPGFRMFLQALGVTKIYGAGSQDTNARFLANHILFGSALSIEVPDLEHTDLLVIFGANPLVSNGSLVYTPRVRHQLDSIAGRGDVFVVDPRRSETAERYRHVAIQPNSDCWLMLAMLKVIASEGLAADKFLEDHAHGWLELQARLHHVDIDDCARRTSVPRDVMVALALRLAQSDRAVCYGRVGICRGPHATLANFLLTALNVVAGNFGRQGCATFATPMLAGSDRPVPGGYGETRTRIGGFPSVTQFLASAVMPDDMLEPGPGQVRALISFGGNVLLAAPGGTKLELALQQLELSVSFDLYVNEAAAHADYILPGLTFYERADLPMMAMTFMVQPFIQYSDAVIPPLGEARSEFDVFCDIVRRMGLKMPAATPAEKEAQMSGRQMRPIEILDLAIQYGPAGATGAAISSLRETPHGRMLDLPAPYGRLSKIGHADGRIHLWDDLIAGEIARLMEADASPEGSLKLITRRDIRSHNGWMHNVDRLIRSQVPRLRINPLDAKSRGFSDGDEALLSNQYGKVRVRLEITDEMLPGVVAYPHCFGHGTGSWKRANKAGGANINVLLGHGADVVERISGTTIMDGISVELTPA